MRDLRDKQNPTIDIIGKKIRSLREAAGFSQEQFAMHIDMARSNYGMLERGKKNLSTVNLVRIAMALDVEVGELFPSLKELKKYWRDHHKN